jgi:hypothetical protein
MSESKLFQIKFRLILKIENHSPNGGLTRDLVNGILIWSTDGDMTMNRETDRLEKSLTRTLNRSLRKARLPQTYAWFKVGGQAATVGNRFDPIATTNRAKRRLEGIKPELRARLAQTACAAGYPGLAFEWRLI